MHSSLKLNIITDAHEMFAISLQTNCSYPILNHRNARVIYVLHYHYTILYTILNTHDSCTINLELKLRSLILKYKNSMLYGT